MALLAPPEIGLFFCLTDIKKATVINGGLRLSDGDWPYSAAIVTTSHFR